MGTAIPYSPLLPASYFLLLVWVRGKVDGHGHPLFLSSYFFLLDG